MRIGYIDLGDASINCNKSFAKMWGAERLAQQKKNTALQLSICCLNGKVQLQELKQASEKLLNLLYQNDRMSRRLQGNIRSYSTMLSFTSHEEKIDTSINSGSRPYTFVLHGQNYHLLGSLLPEEGMRPKFSQLYICNMENEVDNRLHTVR